MPSMPAPTSSRSAAVLYEMTTGRQAFAGSTPGTIHEAILNRTPVPVGRVNPESSPRLEEVINKALEKDPKLRYQHASELRADLQRLKRDSDSGSLDVAPGRSVHLREPVAGGASGR